MPVTIRRAKPEDRSLIAKFNALLALETEDRTLDNLVVVKGVEAILNDPSKGTYYVADLDGTVVGQLLITFEWSDWRNGMFWWIQSVYVREEFRNRGIFKALYRHAENLARDDKGVCGLRLYVEHDNKKAVKTYQKLGMRKTEYDLYEIDFVLKG
ncbi:MAG TPA: GNAT family N-acetyltransferase [Bacteroidota bacterium]